ncbi:phosphoribosylanthranilate isomerase [Thermoplasma sp.]|uniref:phosphoribosylanthranilate isomerase n=1 Tax=Thermoplasma sp. TaxID=1973142 RepID=UPI001274C160|nr:phosphoribosylanthranilate isomerase [Thermoplasma sp.]KAA8921977.1 MAG: phosphoribosylanthranilate isomerase [Thermoplasma sp.]
MIVKVCGVTNFDDAVMVRDAGADIVGFVFDRRSPRYASYSALVETAESGIEVAAVYTDADSVFRSDMLEDFIQLHFPHDQDLIDYVHGQGRKVISVIRYGIDDLEEKYREYHSADIILVERKPRISDIISDHAFDGKRLGFAGGIGIDDVDLVIRRDPVMIDVSSSLEADRGKKDADKVRRFFSAIGDLHESDR